MRWLGVSSLILLAAVAGLGSLLAPFGRSPVDLEGEPQAHVAPVPGALAEIPAPRVREDEPSFATETAGLEVGQGAVDGRAWPEPPEVMESLILQRIAGLNDSRIGPLAGVDCTATDCAIRVMTIGWPAALVQRQSEFARWFSAPPYNAGLSNISISFVDNAQTIRWSSREESRGELFLSTGATAAMLRRRAELYFDDNGSPEDAPSVIGRNDKGAPIIAENVCSYDCPNDTRRLIHVRVPEGQACRDLDGTEQTLMARTAFGGLQERTFCLPELLADD